MATMGFIQSTQENKKNTSILVEETFTHSIAFGETGCGKTTSFIYPNLKHRLELGHGILFYDYKGKEHQSVKYFAAKVKRLDDVVEVGKPWGRNINIIQNMDEDELDKFFDHILDHGENSQFWQNSAKSLGQSVLAILKSIEDFSQEMLLINKDAFENKSYISSKDFKYPLKRSIKSLIQVCKTFEQLGKFIKSLKSLSTKTEEMISNSIVESTHKKDTNSSITEKYKKVIKARMKLLECIELRLETLESFGEDSNENLTENVIGSLIAPLVSLSQNEFYNHHSFDILEALNNGKIVILNMESLSSSLAENLSNTLMYELSKRTGSTYKHPVSIFIDEFQRVVGKKSDLPVDIFREAKVDLFVATQNSALLKDKLKEEKFDALMGNLTHKYYFKNSTDEAIDYELFLLESFEYRSSQDNYTNVEYSEPIFIKDRERLQVELRYQKKLKVLQNYLYTRRTEPLLLEYLPKHYREGKVLCINTKTGKEELVESVSKANMTELNKELLRFMKKAQEKMEKSSDDDLKIDLDLDHDYMAPFL